MTQAKKSNKFYYGTTDNAVTHDTELCKTAIDLYCIMENMMDKKTRSIKQVEVSTLAKLLNRANSTVRVHLATFVRLGIIARILRKHPNNPKRNMASGFVIYGRFALRYRGTEFAGPDNFVWPEGLSPEENELKRKSKIGVPTPKNEREKIPEPLLQDDSLKTTLTRDVCTTYVEQTASNDGEAKATPESIPQPEENPETPRIGLNDTAHHQVVIPDNVPDDLRPTAQYFLYKTGRKRITPNEVKRMRETLKNHWPTRINKEIDVAVARFIRDGKTLSSLSFGYIAHALADQVSRPSAKKTTQSDEKAPQSTPAEAHEELQVSSEEVLHMTVSEAEKVIADYAVSHKTDEIPDALKEMVFASLQAYGDRIDLYDYVSLKLGREYSYDEIEKMYMHSPVQTQTRLHEAFVIDNACAKCESCTECRLPAHTPKGLRSIHISVATRPNGTKCLNAELGGNLPCKHVLSAPQTTDPEYERRVMNSGLTPAQTLQTLDSYKGVSEDAIVAKAHAIMALKNGTNLILSGHAGAGKTHLAIAIAIEAMKAGRNAIVASMPEMLDKICQAHQQHTDPFGLMMKYKEVSCLVLDDWGKERTSEARLDYLYQIIDFRYKHGLQTIVTTNALNKDELKNKFNADKIDPLVSRLLENGDWVSILDAGDYRETLRAERKIETPEPPDTQIDTAVKLGTAQPAIDISGLPKNACETNEKTINSEVARVPVDNVSDVSGDAREYDVDAWIDAQCDEAMFEQNNVEVDAWLDEQCAAGTVPEEPAPEGAPAPEANYRDMAREKMFNPMSETGEYIPLSYEDVVDAGYGLSPQEYAGYMLQRKAKYDELKAERDARASEIPDYAGTSIINADDEPVDVVPELEAWTNEEIQQVYEDLYGENTGLPF